MRSVIRSMETRRHQIDYGDFLDERENLNDSPFFMQHKIYGENDELLAEMTDPAETTPEQKEVIGAELADIYSFVLGIANAYDIDLAQAFRSKLEKNHERFHPHETYAESKRREGRPLVEVDVYNPSINTQDHFEA